MAAEPAEWEAVDLPVRLKAVELVDTDKHSLSNNNNTEVRLECQLQILDLDPWGLWGLVVEAMVVIQGLANMERIASKKIPVPSVTQINSHR